MEGGHGCRRSQEPGGATRGRFGGSSAGAAGTGAVMTSSPHDGTGSEVDAARHGVSLSTDELWLRYFALGGTIGVPGLRAYLTGDEAALNLTERDILVHALNERYSELGFDPPFPYASDGHRISEGGV